MAKPTVFIDGEAGTTGLQIRDRLQSRHDIELVSIDPDKRKDRSERQKLLNAVDVAILCLPDAAARESVSLVTNPAVKILDASTAHRTDPEWVYGFPELEPGQRGAIASSHRVSNPGCYPTGFLACVRPLVASGLIPNDYPISLNATSGYTGGGRKLIETYEANSGYPYGIYGLGFGHKHVAEMHRYSGLSHPPLFVPAVGNVAQGMLVQIPLPLHAFGSVPTSDRLHDALRKAYEGEQFVNVMAADSTEKLRNGTFLDIDTVNGTNLVQIFLFSNDNTQEALLVARLDNLGKGASGAAVQNLNIMLGFEESLGL
ncbi:MAG: N-acetyl-gamma-glutamyl-phosphate reductase [Cyanobacteria bacterium J06597_1]